MTDINKEANKMDNTYYIVRCDRSGVFAGNIVERNNTGGICPLDAQRLRWRSDKKVGGVLSC